MNFILWLIVGGIVGWLASLIMRDAGQGILMNVVVGIVGAFIGGWLISPMVGTGTINDGFSIGAFLVSLVGAIILLAIVNLFRRGRVRSRRPHGFDPGRRTGRRTRQPGRPGPCMTLEASAVRMPFLLDERLRRPRPPAPSC